MSLFVFVERPDAHFKASAVFRDYAENFGLVAFKYLKVRLKGRL